MTIKVEIKNHDSARTAQVKVYDYTRSNGRESFPRETVNIGPGLNAFFYIHLLRQLEISERTP